MRLSVQLGQPVPWDWYLALAWPSCTKYLLASVTAQLLQARAIVQWSQSGATQPCPAPATWNHACLGKLPARRLALTGTPCSQNWWPSTLCTLTAAEEGLGCLCWAHQGRNASPSPQKNPSVFSPVSSPDSHPSPWPTIIKQAASWEKKSQGGISYDFCFYQNLSPGFPKHTWWRSLDWPLKKVYNHSKIKMPLI